MIITTSGLQYWDKGSIIALTVPDYRWHIKLLVWLRLKKNNVRTQWYTVLEIQGNQARIELTPWYQVVKARLKKYGGKLRQFWVAWEARSFRLW